MNKTLYQYVDEHLISPSLVCPICLDILEEPHTHVTCDSAFCRSCLLQLAEPFCPICRWRWDETIPIDYNVFLPKSNRLIRNMLDDLYVQCIHCNINRRRGQFDHECQPNNQKFIRKNLSKLPSKTYENNQTIFSSLSLFLFTIVLYYNRNNLFEKGINRQNELIREIGYNIDYILLENIYYFTINLIEYSILVFIINICLWFSITFYGDRITSKTNSRIIKYFLEGFIIINFILYSIYN